MTTTTTTTTDTSPTSRRRRPASLATLGLFIETKQEQGFYHVTAHPVWIGLTPDERADIDAGRYQSRPDVHCDTIRNASTRYTLWQGGLHLDHLRVTSQGNDSDGARRRLYGWEVEYRDVYTVDRREAARMHKTLTAVERKLDALNDRYGRPATFGAYLLRVAAALGATRIVLPKRERESYDRCEPRVLELGEAAYRVDQLVEEWVAEGQPAQEAV